MNSMRWIRCLLAAALMTVMVAPAVASAAVDGAAPVSTVDTSSLVPSREGDVLTVDGVQRGTRVERGGSGTEFSLEPPPSSTCPGDSEHDSWRVQTFLVPSDVDPGSLVWALGPQSDSANVYSMYDTFTQPVIEGLLIRNEASGEPARMGTLPAMDFAGFLPKGSLPPGNYRVGIACTWYGATGKYWDTEIILTADEADEPAGLTWRLSDAPETPPASSDDGGFPWIYLAIGAVVIAALGWFLMQRAQRTPIPSKEKP
jgi:hypothetical protein